MLWIFKFKRNSSLKLLKKIMNNLKLICKWFKINKKYQNKLPNFQIIKVLKIESKFKVLQKLMKIYKMIKKYNKNN